MGLWLTFVCLQYCLRSWEHFGWRALRDAVIWWLGRKAGVSLPQTRVTPISPISHVLWQKRIKDALSSLPLCAHSLPLCLGTTGVHLIKFPVCVSPLRSPGSSMCLTSYPLTELLNLPGGSGAHRPFLAKKKKKKEKRKHSLPPCPKLPRTHLLCSPIKWQQCLSTTTIVLLALTMEQMSLWILAAMSRQFPFVPP